MERASSWFLFLLPAVLASLFGVFAARQIRDGAMLDWVLAVSGAVFVGVVMGVAIRWGVGRQLRKAAEEAAAGRAQLTATLPHLLPLLFQLRDVRGQAHDNSDALNQLSDRLTAVLQGMQDGVVAVDQHDTILFANDVAVRILQLPQRLIGKHLMQCVRDYRVQNLVEACRAIDRLEEVEIVRNDGACTQLLATPLESSQGPGGVVIVLRDVTELKRLESMRRDFVTNVSHELKTPLSNIRLYAETLADGAVDNSEVRDGFLGRITEQADRLNELIIDLISLAQIESGRQTFEITRVSVRDVAAMCVAENQATIQENDVRVELQVEPDVAVRADEEGLRQIINNLLTNAVKYAAGGTVTIAADRDDQQVRLRVVDTGIGIPAEHQDRLFERFYRVDRARARQLGGTGLGLSIVKHLANAFDGSVGVQSEVGKGSTFYVTLPAVK